MPFLFWLPMIIWLGACGLACDPDARGGGSSKPKTSTGEARAAGDLQLPAFAESDRSAA